MSDPLSQSAAEALLEAAEPGPADRWYSPIAGSLVAGAAADALGWATEFVRSPRSLDSLYGVTKLEDFVAWRKTVGGRFNAYQDFVGPGEYSDDTQLSLCVARALSGPGHLDQEYFAKKELVAWLGYSRGAGRTITAAARKAARKSVPWFLNYFTEGRLDYRESGANGAAMRMGPLALSALSLPEPPLQAAFENAIITHGHPRAHVGALAICSALHHAAPDRKYSGQGEYVQAVCDSLGAWSPEAVTSEPVRQWLAAWGRREYMALYKATLLEFSEMLTIIRQRDTQSVLKALGCFDPATKGSGTATVAAAIHLFIWHGNNVERAVVEGVNAIPADTDTIASLAGYLSGLRSGYEGIPPRWTQRLQDLPYFMTIAEVLARLQTGDGRPESLRARTTNGFVEGPEIVSALKGGELLRDHRVWHAVLGAGWVKAVHLQEIRRRGGGVMAYARVRMDIGQECQFRAHLPVGTSGTAGGLRPSSGGGQKTYRGAELELRDAVEKILNYAELVDAGRAVWPTSLSGALERLRSRLE